MEPMQPSVVLLVPYFGSWPEWAGLYFETLKWNPTVQWVFFTDCGTPPNAGANTTFVPMTLPEFNALASLKLETEIAIRDPYHLCDLKPAFVDMFSEYAAGFEYAGWADIDLLFGDLRRFLDPVLARRPELISFHEAFPSGHFTLLRNTPVMTRAYRRIPDWQRRMGKLEPRFARYLELDEGDFRRVIDRSTAVFQEHFTTPSYFIRSDDGTFDFPREWYWRDGRVTNSKYPDREYPFFHWILWKGYWAEHFGWRQWRGMRGIVHGEAQALAPGVKITRYGFFPLEAGASAMWPTMFDYQVRRIGYEVRTLMPLRKVWRWGVRLSRRASQTSGRSAGR